MNWQRILTLIKKEVIELKRNKFLLCLIFISPILQFFLYTSAIDLNVRNVPTILNDNDHSEFSRTFKDALEQTGYFQILPETDESLEPFKTEKALVNITIPSDFSKRFIRNEHPEILAVFDATVMDTQRALTCLTDMEATIFDRLLVGPLSYLKTPPPAYNLITHAAFNPESNTHFSTIPGLISAILTVFITTLSGMSIVREREFGTIENLLMTPLTFSEILIGKLAPNYFIGIFLSIMILGGSKWLFGFPGPHVNFSLLILLLCLYMVNTLTVGFLFASMANDQTTMLQFNGIYAMPSFLLTGFAFPFYGMPEWAKLISKFLPMTHFLFSLRDILLKEAELHHIFPSILYLTIFTLSTFFLAVKFQRKYIG